jgi:hypothetical protein
MSNGGSWRISAGDEMVAGDGAHRDRPRERPQPIVGIEG